MLSLLKQVQDRTQVCEESCVIEAWSGYEFPGRGSAYSPLRWNKEHFTGIDYDHKTQSKGIWKFQGKEWAQDVDEELGSYDYLYAPGHVLLAPGGLRC